MNGLLVIVFFFIHALLLYVLYRFVVLPRVDETEQGAWMTVMLIGMLIPIGGELLGVLSYWLARRYASEKTTLDDHEYVHFDSLNLERIRQQAEEDADLVPFTDALAMDADKRKYSITQLISTPLAHTDEYLNQGLEHEDTETVHYAATVRNALFDQYDAMIKKKIKRADFSRPETLHPVVETYEAFFDSGLLDLDMRRRIGRQAMVYVEELGRHDATDLTYLRGAARLSFATGSPEEGERFAEALIRHHPEQTDGYLLLIEYYMTNGIWASLRPVLDRLHEYVDAEDIPPDYRSIIRQLEGVIP